MSSLSGPKEAVRADQKSEQTLSPISHRPSPLAALPHYRELHTLVDSLVERLPASMALLSVITGIREKTWNGLREVLSK